ncbi:MAG: fumarylacetoacetate hydrolase family protein [Acidimicrobiia bacterium]|nr:fumarylacetoacetate hydrolase family protein [Acidimicrobiia bacterium]
MRLVTMRTPEGTTRAARLEGDRVVPLDAPDVGAVLEAGVERVAEASTALAAAEVQLAPLVPRPSKIICLGLNYRSHIEEMGAELPDKPTLFAKFAAALIGARDPICLPAASGAVDWEGELAFVIGRRVRNCSQDEGADAIAGYTICNDVSMRDWQWRTSEWLQGKTWERSTPLGPALVTPDEVDHAADLLLRCAVDGEVVQEARTSDLLFKPSDIVSYVSTIVTLEPGDVCSTGTPSGVGAGMQPPRFLQPGQIVRTTIEGLGELVNECVKG